MNGILLAFVFLPIISALLIFMLGRFSKIVGDVAFIASSIILTVIASILYLERPLGNVLTYSLTGISATFGCTLVLDGLSHLILFLINIISILIAIYSVSYMTRYTEKNKYYALLSLMIAGMNGAVLAGDFIGMYIFIELASLASASLVAFGTGKDELEASLKYMIMGSLASMFILFGITLIFGLTGTFSMAAAASQIFSSSSQLKVLLATLFVMGFGTKAALVPFHAWLPDAHPSAPAPVSAMLSGLLIKALGIYSLIRIFFNVIGMTYNLSFIFMLLGALSIIVGSFLALEQKDMKRLMACSSISQIGYIVLGICLATPMGVMGGLLHLFNHSIIKPLLFLTAGSVEHQTGTRNIDELGGLRSKMPITANSSLIASLAISGIPPFGGFWSKLFIIIACVQAGQFIFATIAVFGSLLTLSYFLRLQKRSFFGKLKESLISVTEAPLTMTASMVLLTLFCILSGLFYNQIVSIFINPAVVTVANGLGYSRILGGM